MTQRLNRNKYPWAPRGSSILPVADWKRYPSPRAERVEGGLGNQRWKMEVLLNLAKNANLEILIVNYGFYR